MSIRVCESAGWVELRCAMGGQKVPIATRREIVDLYYNARMAPAAIVRTTGVARRTVFAIIKKWQHHGTVENLPRSGRPRKTTVEVDRRLVRRARRFPFETPRQVLAHFGLTLSTDTVVRRWRQGGIQRNVARRTVLMNPRHITNRFAWCLNPREWSQEQWRQVIWSDERTFHLGQHGRVWVSRPYRKRNAPRFSKPSDSRGPTIMIWACIDGRGKIGYEIVEGTLRYQQYMAILRRALLPYTRRLRRQNRPFKFMHDRAPPHRAKAVSRWLEARGVPLLPWMAKGADLNPIENLWNVLGAEVQAQQPRTREQLTAAIDQAWQSLARSLIQKLVDSVPRQIAQVIARRGFTCDY